MVLSGFAVVAVVGSAFAFIPRYSTNYCTHAVSSGSSCANVKCETKKTSQQIGGSSFFCTTAVPTGGNCSSTLACDNVSPIALQAQPPL